MGLRLGCAGAGRVDARSRLHAVSRECVRCDRAVVLNASIDIDSLRAAYHRDDQFTDLVSRRTRRRLRSIMRHPRFPGATDPLSLYVLGSLVTAIRPRLVLQLGTYIGFSTLVLGDILASFEQPGSLVTVDPDLTAHEIARKYTADARLSNVRFVDGFSLEPRVTGLLHDYGAFDLAYVDSSHEYSQTLAEIDLLFGERPLLTTGGLAIFHDAARTGACFDPTGEGGVARALSEWTEAHSSFQLLVLQQPLFRSVCGLGFLSRS
jgi:predicted O-methyltransferase YrrM